jgi:hypothetical protein
MNMIFYLIWTFHQPLVHFVPHFPLGCPFSQWKKRICNFCNTSVEIVLVPVAHSVTHAMALTILIREHVALSIKMLPFSLMHLVPISVL